MNQFKTTNSNPNQDDYHIIFNTWKRIVTVRFGLVLLLVRCDCARIILLCFFCVWIDMPRDVLNWCALKKETEIKMNEWMNEKDLFNDNIENHLKEFFLSEFKEFMVLILVLGWLFGETALFISGVAHS